MYIQPYKHVYNYTEVNYDCVKSIKFGHFVWQSQGMWSSMENNNLSFRLINSLNPIFVSVWDSISFIQSPESSLGPINYLIWIDQISGFCLFPMLLARIVVILSPVPLSAILNEDFCKMVSIFGEFKEWFPVIYQFKIR